MIHIYYHSADLDGKASGALVYQFLIYTDKVSPEEINVVPINYGVPFKWETIAPEDTVYMVDFAIQPNEEMVKLKDACKELIWIDHHVTAINALKDYNFFGFQEVGFAGCELTWKYFYSDIPNGKKDGSETKMSMPIYLLGRYDVWDNSDAERWQDCLALQCGARVYNTDPKNLEFWDKFLTDPQFFEEVMNKGRVILAYQTNENTSYAKSYAFETELDGHKCIALNRGAASSKIFDAVWDEEKYDFMMPFCALPAGGWTVSLYTTKEGIDVSAIAKNRGGGGHVQAAGFQCDELPFKLPVRVKNEDIP